MRGGSSIGPEGLVESMRACGTALGHLLAVRPEGADH